MQTIGRKWPKAWRGQSTGHCSYCGVRWPSGKLRKDRSGNWACPDETGKDVVTLMEENAAGAASIRPLRETSETGAPYFATDADVATPQRTTLDDI